MSQTPNTHRSSLLIALALLTSGCITSPPSEYGETPLAKKTKLKSCPGGLVDDTEDNDSQILKNEGRDGYWFTFKDPEGTTVEPSGDFVMTEGGPGRAQGLPADSKYAARAKGKVAESGKSVYVGFGFALTSPKTPYDASKYKGVSFWMKGPGKVRFKTPDVNTDPVGDRCDDCYNDFGVDLHVSEEWTRYTVPFDRLAQQPGWGDPAPTVASDALFAVQWQFDTLGAEFDLWVDNVEFVGCE